MMTELNSRLGYSTPRGMCVCGDSLELLQYLQDDSVDLIVTSPPFALQRKKEYGNVNQDRYVEWLCQFGRIVFTKSKDTGSFVVDIGGAYEKGKPTYHLYQFKALIKLCDDIGFHLAQPFYWYNPSALPAPIEWVNKRKMRAKTAVNTIWWLCKQPFCKADISKIIRPLVETSRSRNKDSNITISNLLWLPNSESNTQYLRFCKAAGIKGHPARFPVKLPEFFIQYLTDENDLVVDIFGGSNATGQAAEQLNRNWLSFELSPNYVASSSFRFSKSTDTAKENYNLIMSGKHINIK